MSVPLVITPGDSGHITHHQDIHDLLDYTVIGENLRDWVLARYGTGTLDPDQRGAAETAGTFFLATDEGANGELSLDNGSGWAALWRLMPNAQWDLRSGSGNDNISKFRIPACRVSTSGSQAISDDGNFHPILYIDETGANHFNNEGTSLHNPGLNAGRFVATRDGAWAIGTHIKWAENTTGRRRFRIQKNNGAVLAQDTRDPGDGTQDFRHMLTGSSIVEMEIGDFLQVEVWQNTGGNLNVEESTAWFHFVTDVA